LAGEKKKKEKEKGKKERLRSQNVKKRKTVNFANESSNRKKKKGEKKTTLHSSITTGEGKKQGSNLQRHLQKRGQALRVLVWQGRKLTPLAQGRGRVSGCAPRGGATQKSLLRAKREKGGD